jgi:RNA polymerase sigma-70 factor (ECF subfamily)
MLPNSQMPLSTEDPILPLVANGDRKAVSLCIRRYGPLVWSIARRMSPTPSDAEDAVQEIFLDIWRHAGRFDRTLGSEKVFVATLARRRLIDRLRSMRTRLSTETPLDDIPEPEAETDTLTERDAEIRHARAVLATLPIPQQRVISLSLLRTEPVFPSGQSRQCSAEEYCAHVRCCRSRPPWSAAMRTIHERPRLRPGQIDGTQRR